MKQKAISPVDDYFKKIDLEKKEDEIIKSISQKTGFVLKEIIYKSRYFTKGVGAFVMKGEIKKEKVVVKVQGPKPEINEIDMINNFKKQNKSKLIRAPRIIKYFPRKIGQEWEVIVMEDVKGKKIIESGKLASKRQIKEFFDVWEEYKKNCVNKAWLSRPEKNISYFSSFSKLVKIREDSEGKELIKVEDEKLIKKTVLFLDRKFKKIEPVFLHGHLSCHDLIKFKGKVVIFSNLFWKYRWPLYDLVFAYEWYLLSIAHENIEKIKKQIEWWKEVMSNTKEAKKQSKNYHLALLERMTAALNLDILMIAEIKDRKKMKTILIKEIKRIRKLFN
ncbi:hypothetical protein KKC08_02280 [Patescibacteria group bacterium]|nr:hypothetical protein [Patescibacteria group bacterium]MCG2701929.1 hypothetical protein [Candidatus Parcubacteria bacterium]MBU4265176.1 hypothetical protein [Patescibacteria group bacterium]MBU4390740.1 hypothetical protein [Patescibacteria group bacterium]MBU4396967.1 hypothetical protein [Patescibacteria group bacterium]